MMNERIRELADKIWEEKYWTNPNTDKLLPAQLNRFAELIVRECVAICQDIDGEDNTDARSGRQDCAVEIKEHFGVEE
jgi:hypothetical protein